MIEVTDVANFVIRNFLLTLDALGTELDGKELLSATDTTGEVTHDILPSSTCGFY